MTKNFNLSSVVSVSNIINEDCGSKRSLLTLVTRLGKDNETPSFVLRKILFVNLILLYPTRDWGIDKRKRGSKY
jgi:hypothetical protein